jgi:phage shock protein C
MEAPKDSRSAVGLAIGIALVAFGAWLFLRDSGFVPSFIFDVINRVAWPVAIIVAGVALIYVARRVEAPAAGTRLYRSRGDRWVAGVLGGLGAYIGIDPTVLRIVFIVLSIVAFWPLLLAYIVGAAIVPEEPFTVTPSADE